MQRATRVADCRIRRRPLGLSPKLAAAAETLEPPQPANGAIAVLIKTMVYFARTNISRIIYCVPCWYANKFVFVRSEWVVLFTRHRAWRYNNNVEASHPASLRISSRHADTDLEWEAAGR